MLVSVGRELRLCISQPKTNRRFRMEKANPLKEKNCFACSGAIDIRAEICPKCGVRQYHP
jgi:hypothetical protein